MGLVGHLFDDNLSDSSDHKITEHSCGVCGGALQGKKAFATCIGKHEFPCPKYHKILFRQGKWSLFAAVANADETLVDNGERCAS